MLLSLLELSWTLENSYWPSQNHFSMHYTTGTWSKFCLMDQVKPFWKENSLSTASNQHENVGAIKEKDWKDSFLLTSNALLYNQNWRKYDKLVLVQSQYSREWKIFGKISDRMIIYIHFQLTTISRKQIRWCNYLRCWWNDLRKVDITR